MAHSGKHHTCFVDRTNTRVGLLTVLRYAGYTKHTSLWECVCDCGTVKTVHSAYLRRLADKASCGCLKAKKAATVVVCKHCSKPFSKVACKAKSRIYCSRECFAASRVGVKRRPKAYRQPLECKQCHKTFFPVASEAPRRVYCSIACKNAAKSGQVPRVCRNCNKEFTKPRSTVQQGSGLYCSRDCWRVHRANVFHVVKVRGSCEGCGWSVAPLLLTIHHKDRNRKNNVVENLQLLCWNCHLLEHLNAGDGPYHSTRSETSPLLASLRSLEKSLSALHDRKET